jgi:hypothetical protein
MNSRIRISAVTIATVVLLPACSTVRTISDTPEQDRAAIQIPYYLPRGLVTIDLSYKPKTQKVTKVTESNGPSGPTKVTEIREETDKTTLVPVLTTSLAYSADEDAGLKYARYSKNALSDDAVTVKAPEGLLQSASGTSEDKSLVVVENLALAGLEALKLPFFGPVPFMTLDPNKESERPEVHLTIDPTDDGELANANTALAKIGMSMKPGLSQSSTDGKLTTAKDGKLATAKDGLQFRPLRFYRLYEGDQVIASFGVPDRRFTFTVPLARSAFVSFKTSLEIQDGILRSYSVEKKSEAAAVSGLPLRLLKEVTALPKGLLVYQESQVSAETKLIDAQTAQIKAAIELEKARAQHSATNAPASP